ncbi:MAG: hypothetical protein Q9168_002929 [Polycauliona sp. 1 TL-2023]
MSVQLSYTHPDQTPSREQVHKDIDGVRTSLLAFAEKVQKAWILELPPFVTSPIENSLKFINAVVPWLEEQIRADPSAASTATAQFLKPQLNNILIPARVAQTNMWKIVQDD